MNASQAQIGVRACTPKQIGVRACTPKQIGVVELLLG
jgi:hypothetical protein